MNEEPVPPPSAEPPPPAISPVVKDGSIVGGCFAYFVLLIFIGIATSSLMSVYPLNLGLPLLVVLFFSISIARHGWNRTHTGIAIGFLLTLGAFLLLQSICGRGF